MKETYRSPTSPEEKTSYYCTFVAVGATANETLKKRKRVGRVYLGRESYDEWPATIKDLLGPRPSVNETKRVLLKFLRSGEDDLEWSGHRSSCIQPNCLYLL